jgi:uncharacterized membrane-anchored protein
MRPFPTAAYWAVVGLQLLVLLGMIGQRSWLLAYGDRVVIDCQPLDPRSLFSGDYVRLEYRISDLDRQGGFAALNVYHETFDRAHDRVYVALRAADDGRFWRPVAVSHSLGRLRRDGHRVVLRGVTADRWSHRVRYGVEDYFVPQSEGRRLEGRRGDTSLELAVDSSGQSAIRRLFIAGEEVSFQ